VCIIHLQTGHGKRIAWNNDIVKKGETFLYVIHFIPIPESCDISQNDFDLPMQLNCQTVKSGELGAVK